MENQPKKRRTEAVNIVDLNRDVTQLIFGWLSVRDLFSLMRTSKEFEQRVNGCNWKDRCISFWNSETIQNVENCATLKFDEPLIWKNCLRQPYWKERYKADQQEAVWEEIQVFEERHRQSYQRLFSTEVTPVVQEAMRRLKHNLEVIASELVHLEYFSDLKRETFISKSQTEDEIHAALDAIEAKHSQIRFPLLLRYFWATIGGVDFACSNGSAVDWWKSRYNISRIWDYPTFEEFAKTDIDVSEGASILLDGERGLSGCCWTIPMDGSFDPKIGWWRQTFFDDKDRSSWGNGTLMDYWRHIVCYAGFWDFAFRKDQFPRVLRFCRDPDKILPF
eukprot:TRINITY_DN3933_c0_g1_i2.p1 TRINITY_DN3933_c0_g1~~TRINITY_DN3933_c0_g1_i2.p1  ORF type:complete len:334 (+),score=50.28 TRINITY_DN3933_c0_g1_i2:166-1167(+)